MIIKKFPSGPFQTNAYVVACPLTKQAAILDPAPGSSAPIADLLEASQLIPMKILLTHSHWDHIAEAASLQAKYQIPVYIHPLDAGNLESPGSDGLPLWISIQGTRPDQLYEEGQQVSVGRLAFKVIHTPGHTPGGVCLYCPEEEVLFSGDTLFKGSIGNLSFPTADPEAMWNSLAKLAALPKSTQVHPGHGPSTTIGKESWLDNAKQIFG